MNGLVQDCMNSSALAMELQQSCTKPSVSFIKINIQQSMTKHKFKFYNKVNHIVNMQGYA